MMREFLLPAAVMALLAPLVQAADIAPELWDRPRSAQRVMAQPAVQRAVAAYQARPAARIVILHNARQESQLQAVELRAWLAALAVDRVQLQTDPTASLLRIEVAE